jgi:SAM-dependent methyltransferase
VSETETPPPPDERSDEELLGVNRHLWDSWTQLHVDSDHYDLPGFMAGRNSLDQVELEGVGPVRGRSLLHLQCHFGLGTLSFARLGARVTGVDFSSEAVGHARRLAAELGLEARFLCAEVTRVLPLLDGEEFDVVITSYGALSWLPDLAPWARTIAGALKPGGCFFVADQHPTVWIFDDEATEVELRYRYGYFDRRALRSEEKGSYAVPNGDFEGEDGFFRMPAGGPDIPLMFSLTATKDAIPAQA